MRLQPEEIFRYALEAGFSPDQAVTMTAVAMAESGGNPQAHNPVGEDSIGLWQVNRQAHPDFVGLDGTDPLVNARMAYEVSGGGADIGRWTVTHADKGAPYLRYRAQAEAAAAANGYPDAVGQWNPPENYYSPKVSAGPPGDGAPIDATAEPVVADTTDTPVSEADDASESALDQDADGLVARYEQALGTDVDAVDTDRDGFADSVEVLHGTDPVDFASNPLVAPTDDPAAFRPELTTTTPTVREAPTPPSEPQGATAAGEAPGDAATSAAEPGSVVPEIDPGPVTEPGPLDGFLDAALSQDGAPYIFGAEVDVADPDPKAGGEAFDCSELIEWAAGRVGVEIPDGSYNQYLHLRDLGTELTVEEALRTPGALVFNFSSEPVPGGARPAQAHVGISLGDGRLIEARGRKYGVGQFDTAGREFSHAAFIPELGTELTPELAGVDGNVLAEPLPTIWDSDNDSLLDAYEQLISIDPFAPDTDRDGFVDGVELAHGTDPLDFADNPLVGDAVAAYHPPLTTEVPPVGEPVPQEPEWDQLPTAPEDAPEHGWGSEQLPAYQGDEAVEWQEDLLDVHDADIADEADDADLDDVDDADDADHDDVS